MRILYIDIDSLRPDHLSCYGYHRQTSPNIDSLAAEGVRFSNFYATDTPCLPSRTALFTGRFGFCTGVVNHGGVYADHYVGRLIQDLKDLGIYGETAIIISTDHGENHGELNVWGDHQTADHICKSTSRCRRTTLDYWIRIIRMVKVF